MVRLLIHWMLFNIMLRLDRDSPKTMRYKASILEASPKALFMSSKTAGFTLIEIMIALAIFAIIATLTSGALLRSLQIGSHIAKQSEALHALQFTLALMSRDTTQIINRPIRGEEMRLFPAFIGQPQYLEFTRTGQTNPGSRDKQSNLIRVAYHCGEHQLERITYSQLDLVKRDQPEVEVLLSDLTQCHFTYLNAPLQVLSVWRAGALTQTQQSEPYPKAIRIEFTHLSWGHFVSLFIIPGALYAETR